MTADSTADKTPDPDELPLGSPWDDLRAYVGTPRLQSLLLSSDGSTLLASVSELDDQQTGYRTSWWRVDPAAAGPARRMTRSVEGESIAAFTPDGSLIFGSGRPTPAARTGYGPKPATKPSDDDGVLWFLPAGGGEAHPIARRSGGWQDIATARHVGRAVLAADSFPGAETEQQDQDLRKLRKTKKVSALLHEGYPVRFWDHDLGGSQTRLYGADLTVTDDRGDLSVELEAATVLAPDSGRRLGDIEAVADDGSFAVATWKTPRPRGRVSIGLIEIDLSTGARSTLVEQDGVEFSSAVISSDGSLVAAVRETAPTAEEAPTLQLWLIDRSSGDERVLAADWDRWATPYAFSPDGSVLYVVADEDGQAPIFAVDVAAGRARRLTEDGAFGSLLLSPDGSTLYALRSSYTDPGSIVSVDVASGRLTVLRGPVDYPELPGSLTEVETTAADGARIRAHLALPADASAAHPAPLALWIHGGPLGSWNAWSWRWNPWLLVSQGYAVLLPDPALSTGYGRDFIQRGWGRWGAEPYTDLMAITDAAVDRDDIDADDTVAMGGSFGGYMANWVAGHTDRFAGIVTHASLWNLAAFRYTTDSATFWLPELTDAMVQQNSPHLFVDRIRTPMLVIHGDKDYRVPIAEGLGLWAALVEQHDGPAEELPHKFLYFPDENHWVLSPQHAIVWYETVRSFLESVRTGGNFVRSRVL
ncbi:S9 family peptidase [Microlunatus soli]|uniref:Dipeptidyl aminopeptidase/acylaminoacyl peptidase n=1 Tax=Microlunatus soli TaxID=630515 RepID=A0A1H1M9X7_9ACTN|nr:prolyl oligopeptidase family serine peptidase [Microlunatus soli]SDR82789.1 Dipeptidyl aminopeptidase/acylaminoacyl peptidase [Microlunatus soli]